MLKRKRIIDKFIDINKNRQCITRTIKVSCLSHFLRADPHNQHPKNQLVLYRPGFAASLPGKNQLTGPAPTGHSLLVSRFLPTREQTINRIIQHRITNAKTRATIMLRHPAHSAERYGQFGKNASHLYTC